MRAHRSYMGVSLIELTFSLGLLALLAGLAAPGFRVSLRTAALRSATFELLAGVQQARVTSIEQSRPGLLCPTDSAGRCAAAGVAATSWRSFLEEDGGWRELGGQSLPAGVNLRATRSPIRFWPTALAASPGTLTICHVAGGDASAIPPRAIVISQAGRPRVEVAAREDCAP